MPVKRDMRRKANGEYMGDDLVSLWAWFPGRWSTLSNGKEFYNPAHLGSLDDVASFAPRLCRLTIYEDGPDTFLADCERHEIAAWLSERKITVRFKKYRPWVHQTKYGESKRYSPDLEITE